MLFVVLFLLYVNTSLAQKEQTWAVVGNPLVHDRPCKDNDDIIISYEPGRPPGEENQYTLRIPGNFSVHSEINVKFDSEATVTLGDPSKARISFLKNEFNIRFFKFGQGAVLMVKGPAIGTIPYATSINVNTAEYCREPKTGYLDKFIIGYKETAETESEPKDVSCGRRKVVHTELITNGLASKPGDWPWHVAIYRLDKTKINYICGGTVVSKSFILTAAHCASIRGQPVLPEILSVILGKYNLIGGDDGTQEREIHKIIMHDEFNKTRLENDIALLKMKTEAIFTDYVQPVCLWNSNAYKKLPPGKFLGIVVGWGFNQKDQLSSQLHQTTVPKVSETTCIKSNPGFFGTILSDKKFCGGWNNGSSACNGDSGGGFTVFIPDKTGDESPDAPGAYYIRGIVSLSIARKDIALCDPYQYVVFTDVAKYKGWLQKHMK